MAKKQKRPVSQTVVSKKTPVDSPELETNECLHFRFDRADLDGRWSLGKMSAEDAEDFFTCLKSISSMTATEVFKSNKGDFYKDMSLSPEPEAARLLGEKYEGADSLHVLRVTSTKRLLGFRVGTVFSAIWWDPNHEVWPSTKKHT